MAVNTAKILVKGIARGEIQRMLRDARSLHGLWQQRYNVAGLVLFTADQLLQLEELITMLEEQLARLTPQGPV